MMKFTYDRRRRLTHEVRQTYDGSPAYDFAYEYDAGGNRTKKIDAVAQTETRYHYDVDADANPPEGNVYGSFNNRLQWYEVYSTAGAMPRLSRTWYFYFYGPDGKSSGNVERIVTKSDASSHYTATFFKYGKNNRTVNYIVGEQWEWNGTDACVPNATYERTYAWEFRYDAARQRYATRPLNPTGLNAVNPQYYNKGRMWSDYDGDSLYGDFEIQSGQGGHTIERSSYEPGLGRFGWTSGQPDYTTERYYHSDHLGSVRGTTNFFSTWVEPLAYTAFGERITGTQNSYMTRVGYVGAHGYQSTPILDTNPHTDIGYLHLGHRYYDPSSGRFLQRDPIGISGGLNVYLYVGGSPTWSIDPLGLSERPKTLPESYVRKEGKTVTRTIGNIGAAVGEVTCAAIGLGWLWGKDKFKTGDLFRKVEKAAKKLGENSPPYPLPNPGPGGNPPPTPTPAPSPPTNPGGIG